MPMNWMGAFTPPMVIWAGSLGFGSDVNGVAGSGEEPVARAGETCPSPVMNRTSVWPRDPLREGTVNPLASVKTPGAELVTVKLKVAVLNPSAEITLRVAGPGWVS